MFEVILLGIVINNTDIDCLAMNVYHEARSESIAGQYAVAYVTLNRVKDNRFPNSVCDVVQQKKKNVCQFSWYCDGLSDNVYELNTFKRIKNTLNQLQHVKDPTEGATHYHSKKIYPYWAPTLQHTKIIGEHTFYKWRKR